MPRSPEPSIEVRRYELAGGKVTETYSLRWYDAFVRRRRKTCASREEADFERARIVLERSRGGGPTSAVVAEPR